MSSFDDDLRDALASHAERVGSVADVLPDVRRRARRLRRRRAAGVAVAASMAVLLLGSLPMVLRPGLHSAAAPAAAPPLLTPSASASPGNGEAPPAMLAWGPRGDMAAVPASLRRSALARLAQLLGVRNEQVTVAPLYAAQTAALGRDWVYVAQGWSPVSKGKPAQVVAVRATAAGKNAHPVSGGSVLSRHGSLPPTGSLVSNTSGGAAPSPSPSPSGTLSAAVDAGQLPLLSFGLDTAKAVTLLLGDPRRVSGFVYSRDGVTFGEVAGRGGVAVFTRRPISLDGLVLDMVRALDASGHSLTPADTHALRVADASPEVDSVPDGWSLPDYPAAP